MLSRYCKPIVAVAVAVLVLAAASTEIGAQSSGRRAIRLPDMAAIGLPEDAPVNGTLFLGLKLTPAQADAVVRAARQFEVEARQIPRSAPGAPPDSATRARMLPFLERQRNTYRAILRVDQRETFDRNAAAILHNWLSGRSRVVPRRDTVPILPADRP